VRVAYVYTGEKRDRAYATRPDGSTTAMRPWSYGNALPHDLAHLAVERALGLGQGVWGLVAMGVDFERAAKAAEAAATGRKVRDMVGRDTAELRVAEAAVAAMSLLPGQPDRTVADSIADIEAAYRAEHLAPPQDLADRVAAARRACDDLAARWSGLAPGEQVVEEFPA
jgi:hypothetical protein